MRAALLPLILIALAAGQDAAPDELFTLQIGNQKHELVGGRAYELEIHGQKTPVKVTPLPHRELVTKWFSFRFPREFHYSHEGGAEMAGQRIWTVEYDASFVKLIKTIAQTEKEALDFWIEETQGDKVRLSPVTLAIGKRSWKGARIDDSSDPDIVTRSLVLTHEKGGVVWLLYTFDVPDKKGQMSKELRPAFELFRRTFKFR